MSFFLVACSSAPVVMLTPSAIPATETPTLVPPTATETLTPVPTATETITPSPTPIPCYLTEAVCVEDGHFLLERPISAEYVNTIHPGYRYGSTIDDTREPHHGVEFVNASGTPVLAAADGRVIFADYDKAGIYSYWPDFYGNLVVIEHDMPELGEPLYTLYAHLSVIGVAEGDLVTAGQQIGEVGWTGRAIGSHLHFEVRLGGLAYSDTRNPELWLKPLDSQSGGVAVTLINVSGQVRQVPVNVDHVQDGESVLKWVASLPAYAPEAEPVGIDNAWQESHAMGDLPAGSYRLSFSYAGQYWERFVDVIPKKVTVVKFVVQE